MITCNTETMATASLSNERASTRLPSDWTTWLALAALCLLAFSVRVYRIDYDPVWFDEAATIGIASLALTDLFGDMARLESSPAGYYAIIKLWGGIFGLQIVPLRLLSAIAGALAIVPIWLTARDVGGKRAAWLAAGLLALATTHVRLSQDARTYALLFLPASLALLFVVRLGLHNALDRVAARYVLLIGLLQGSMLWLHSTAAFILFGLNACLFISACLGALGFRNAVIIVIAVDLVTGLCALVPIVHAMSHILEPQFVDRWIDEPDLQETVRLYGRALIAPFLHEASYIAGGIYAALIAVATIIALQHRNAAMFGLLAMLLVAGITLPLVSAIVPVLLDRTALFLLAPLLILISAGAACLPRFMYPPVAGLLVVLQAIGLFNYQSMTIRKEQWPNVAAALHGRVGSDAVVVMTEGVFAAIALEIPLQALGDTPRIIVAPPTAVMEQFVASRLAKTPLLNPAALCSVLNGANEVWVVTRSLPDTVADDPGYSSRNQIVEALRAAGATRTATPQTVDHFLIDRWVGPHCR